MDRAAKARGNVSQVDGYRGPNGNVDVRIRHFAGLDAINPVAVILDDRALRSTVEVHVQRSVPLPADFELTSLADKHLSFCAEVLGAAIDVVRIRRRPQALLEHEHPTLAHFAAGR